LKLNACTDDFQECRSINNRYWNGELGSPPIGDLKKLRSTNFPKFSPGPAAINRQDAAQHFSVSDFFVFLRRQHFFGKAERHWTESSARDILLDRGARRSRGI
jgi:hypothetical protein